VAHVPSPVPDTEPYPSERFRLRHAYEQLSRRFANTPLTDTNLDCFLRAAADLFGEAGFTVDVGIDQVYQNGRPTGLFIPEVTVTGRVVHQTEQDHDRIQWEVREGLADGVKGVIREDGTRTEEPRKKIIG